MSLSRPHQESEGWHLGRKVALLFLLVVAVALGLVILSRQGRNVPLVLFNLFADASLGLLMGMGSRLVLRRRNWFIQASASAALSIVGLAVLGYFTDSRSGIGPLDFRLVRVHWLDWARLALQLPLQVGRSTMDLLDLAHIVVAVDTSWMVLRAWPRRSRVSGMTSAVLSPPRQVIEAAPARWSVVPNTSMLQVRPRTVSGARPLVRRRKLGRPLISTGVAAVRPARPASRRRNPFHRRLVVQLAAHEEHRCPYCLEDVKRNDARGSVECPVCHTLHHKDCWDITGTCQVPHLNT